MIKPALFTIIWDSANTQSEIVFIGQDLNREWIKKKLDNAVTSISLERAE